MPDLEPSCVLEPIRLSLKDNLSLSYYIYPWGDVCPLREVGEKNNYATSGFTYHILYLVAQCV